MDNCHSKHAHRTVSCKTKGDKNGVTPSIDALQYHFNYQSTNPNTYPNPFPNLRRKLLINRWSHYPNKVWQTVDLQKAERHEYPLYYSASPIIHMWSRELPCLVSLPPTTTIHTVSFNCTFCRAVYRGCTFASNKILFLTRQTLKTANRLDQGCTTLFLEIYRQTLI
jgi:hypothetical protein